MKIHLNNNNGILNVALDGRLDTTTAPELEKLRLEMSEWYEQEEDVLSYAQFGQVAVKFFEQRRNAKYGVDGAHYDAENKVHPV